MTGIKRNESRPPDPRRSFKSTYKPPPPQPIPDIPRPREGYKRFFVSTIVKETKKARCYRISGTDVWLPKSQTRLMPDETGAKRLLDVPNWIYKSRPELKGLQVG